MTAWAAKFCTSAICLSVKGRTSWRYTINEPTSLLLLQHRNDEWTRTPPSSTAATKSDAAAQCKRRSAARSEDVNTTFLLQHPVRRIIWVTRNCECLRCSAEQAVVLCVATRCKRVTVPAKDIAELGVADANGFLQHCRKHRLHIARRAADDLQHLRRSGLLLKRLAQLGEQPRVLDGDDRLGGEILTKAICLSVKGRTS